jgi:transposase
MYCGIDVAKNKSQVCVLNKDLSVMYEFGIEHTLEGFEKLDKHLAPDTKIGMETTANYCKTLFSFLKQKHNVCYVDNVQMKNFAKLHFQFVKNDRVDAKLIAKYMAFDFKKIEPVRFNELKDLTRLYSKTVKNMTRYKFMFLDQLNIIFPELETHFHVKVGKTIPYLLMKYPTPAEIARLSADEIELAMTEKLSKHGSLTNAKKTLDTIMRLAKCSVGVRNYPTAAFRYTIRVMMYFEELVEEIRGSIDENLKKTEYYRLMDLFGYNTVSLGTIVAEVGDIRRFTGPKAFVRFCGLDISQKQSGNYSSQNCFITKQGNSLLRTMFYNLAMTHLRYKTEVSRFYYRLRDEKKKHPRACLIATARKLAVKCFFDMGGCHKS